MMRIQRLSLDRFGQFTDRHFDFGSRGDRPDFHIIYGPNEAGKTTTMEAALRLFYGFPMRDGYAFKHQRPNLQVSATLDIDGQSRDVTRLPKRSGSLVDANGTALPEAALSGALAGLSEGDYRQLLCLDDDTIERGGEEIAQARGDIGRLLFSAAAGVADLSAVLDGVRDQASGIWKKRSSKTRIAELKREFSDVEKEIREGDVSANTWRSLKKALSDAQVSENAARTSRDALLKTAAKIASQKRTIPMLVEINNLDARIAPFSDYPIRLDFDPERLVELRSDETTASGDVIRLTTEIAELTTAHDAILLDPKQVDSAEQLDALDDLRARDRTADMDLVRRQDQELAAETAMGLAARDLGISPGIDPKTLVLSPADIAQLENARDVLRKAASTTETEGREIAELTDCQTDAQENLEAALTDITSDAQIGEILERFDVDRLAPAVSAANQALDAARGAARVALKALSIGGALTDETFDNLPTCPTSLIQAQDWVDDIANLRQKIASIEDTKAQHLTDQAARTAQGETLTANGSLVADATTDELQNERDQLWYAHTAALTTETAKPFVTAMQALDVAMQSRVTHARDLGQLRQVEQAQAEAQARAKQADIRLTALQGDLATLEDTVNAAASKVHGSRSLNSAEWFDWVERHASARVASEALSIAQETHQPVLDRAQKFLDVVTPLLQLDAPDFDSAIFSARKIADDERQKASQVSKFRDILEQAKQSLSRRQVKYTTVQRAEVQAKEVWQNLLVTLLEDAVTSDTLMASLEPLRNLREQEEKRVTAKRRVDTMQADQQQFIEKISALASLHGVANSEESGATSSAIFATLRDLSDAAKIAHEKSLGLTKSIELAQENLTENKAKLSRIARDVEIIGALFPSATPVDNIDALRRATTQAQQTIEDRKNAAKLERAILSELGVSDITTAREALSEVTIAALEAAAVSTNSDLVTAESGLTTSTETRVVAEQELTQVTGDAGIATLTERKITLELQLEEAALEHLELSLGHRLASDAIRRYRDSHRSGMLTSTERCFATLTRGAYPQLTTLADGADEILLAVDQNGVTKRAADMSKGTRFQLYLALRAAAHEQLVAQGTCLPFFCDDIFETFDEGRTSAACRVMEEIGRKGQAIYLTHHRHVVDIAMKVCDTRPILHEI